MRSHCTRGADWLWLEGNRRHGGMPSDVFRFISAFRLRGAAHDVKRRNVAEAGEILNLQLMKVRDNLPVRVSVLCVRARSGGE
jgi:hypothetical protein